MAVYSYTGIDEQAAQVRGTIAADTPRQARDQLRTQGLRVKRLIPCETAEGQRAWRWVTVRAGRGQWATAVHEMSMLLHAGVPLLDAIDTVCKQSRGGFRTALLRVRDSVSAGVSLADSLEQQPDWFDSASIQMVRVGESSGTLETVLSELADFKSKQLRLRDAVTTALVYPVFLICFGTAAAVFLMTSVLPPLLENLQETTDTLPFPTRVAKACSDLLLGYGLWMLIGLMLVVVAFAFLMQTTRGQRVWYRTLLKLPLIGPMAVKQGVSRIAMIVGTLARSGVELPKAIELARDSTRNVVFQDALRQCGQRIAAGEEIAEALEQSEAFPPLAVRVFSVGQDSGKLDEMLFRLSEDYDEQVATTSARLTSLLEPVLILFLALLVGFLLLATILPILEAGNVM
ncbi:MAG: type II secretion system F family protein [Planctomycetota bacterium]